MRYLVWWASEKAWKPYFDDTCPPLGKGDLMCRTVDELDHITLRHQIPNPPAELVAWLGAGEDRYYGGEEDERE